MGWGGGGVGASSQGFSKSKGLVPLPRPVTRACWPNPARVRSAPCVLTAGREHSARGAKVGGEVVTE